MEIVHELKGEVGAYSLTTLLQIERAVSPNLCKYYRINVPSVLSPRDFFFFVNDL